MALLEWEWDETGSKEFDNNMWRSKGFRIMYTISTGSGKEYGIIAGEITSNNATLHMISNTIFSLQNAKEIAQKFENEDVQLYNLRKPTLLSLFPNLDDIMRGNLENKMNHTLDTPVQPEHVIKDIQDKQKDIEDKRLSCMYAITQKWQNFVDFAKFKEEVHLAEIIELFSMPVREFMTNNYPVLLSHPRNREEMWLLAVSNG